MPTYSYACEIGHPYIETRGISDPQQRTTCPKPDCAKKLKRKFENTAVVFKGKGILTLTGVSGKVYIH